MVGTNGTLEYTNCPASPPARLWDDPQTFGQHRTLNPGGGVDAAWLNVTVVNPPFAGHVLAKPGTNAGTWPNISIANNVVGSVTNNHGFLHTSGGQFSFRPDSPGHSGTLPRFIIDREACFT